MLVIKTGDSPRWFALFLKEQDNEFNFLKRTHANSGFHYDEIDGHFAVSTPRLNRCQSREEAVSEGYDFVRRTNAALRISTEAYDELSLHALIERTPQGTLNRVMTIQSASIVLPSVSAVAAVGGSSAAGRSREERLASLILSDDRMADLADTLSVRPVSWAAMAKIYESVKGIVSGDRANYQRLIDEGWITESDSMDFHGTAAFHKHGYPKDPNRAPNPMSFKRAFEITQELFWRLVDRLEPR